MKTHFIFTICFRVNRSSLRRSVNGLRFSRVTRPSEVFIEKRCFRGLLHLKSLTERSRRLEWFSRRIWEDQKYSEKCSDMPDHSKVAWPLFTVESNVCVDYLDFAQETDEEEKLWRDFTILILNQAGALWAKHFLTRMETTNNKSRISPLNTTTVSSSSLILGSAVFGDLHTQPFAICWMDWWPINITEILSFQCSCILLHRGEIFFIPIHKWNCRLVVSTKCRLSNANFLDDSNIRTLLIFILKMMNFRWPKNVDFITLNEATGNGDLFGITFYETLNWSFRFFLCRVNQ